MTLNRISYSATDELQKVCFFNYTIRIYAIINMTNDSFCLLKKIHSINISLWKKNKNIDSKSVLNDYK